MSQVQQISCGTPPSTRNFDVVLVNLLGVESKDADYLEGRDYDYPEIECTVKRMLRTPEDSKIVIRHYCQVLFGYEIRIDVQQMSCATQEERDRIHSVMKFVSHRDEYRPAHDHIVLNQEDVDNADDSCWDEILIKYESEMEDSEE